MRASWEPVAQRFLDRTQPSLEAQLCNLADEIAYNATTSTTACVPA